MIVKDHIPERTVSWIESHLYGLSFGAVLLLLVFFVVLSFSRQEEIIDKQEDLDRLGEQMIELQEHAEKERAVLLSVLERQNQRLAELGQEPEDIPTLMPERRRDSDRDEDAAPRRSPRRSTTTTTQRPPDNAPPNITTTTEPPPSCTTIPLIGECAPGT